MKNIINTYLLAMLVLTSNIAAAYESCGTIAVKDITVQATRTNGDASANTMRINVRGGDCEGVNYAYLKNTHAAYSSTLSLLLAAQATGDMVFVAVSPTESLANGVREIEFITK